MLLLSKTFIYMPIGCIVAGKLNLQFTFAAFDKTFQNANPRVRAPLQGDTQMFERVRARARSIARIEGIASGVCVVAINAIAADNREGGSDDDGGCRGGERARAPLNTSTASVVAYNTSASQIRGMASERAVNVRSSSGGGGDGGDDDNDDDARSVVYAFARARALARSRCSDAR